MREICRLPAIALLITKSTFVFNNNDIIYSCLVKRYSLSENKEKYNKSVVISDFNVKHSRDIAETVRLKAWFPFS